MNLHVRKIAIRFVALVVVGIAIAGGAWFIFLREKKPAAQSTAEARANETSPPVELVEGSRDTIRITPQLVDSLGIKFSEAHGAPPPESLQLAGSLFADPSRLRRLHSRFAGDVVALGTVKDGDDERPLRFGDKVKVGDVLAIVWSKEVGEKKSELVDALSSLAVRKAKLDRVKSLNPGILTLDKISEAERDHQSAVIAVERAERTLRAWNLQDEIKEAHDEAARIQAGESAGDTAAERRWAEIPIVSSIDGEVLEVNVAVGEFIDTNLDLFKIGDLSRLGVFAQAYEDDLPLLTAIPPSQREWTIIFNTNAGTQPLRGKFDQIGEIIDPTQHTATVIGWVDNRDRQMKVGQFVTTHIHLPQQAGEVCIPSSGVIEDGNSNTILVVKDSSQTLLQRRKVAITRRGVDRTCIRIHPTSAERAAGAEPLHEGEMVVSSGVLELDGALETLQAEHLARK